MNDQGEDKEKGQKQWLKEHETIQVDLLKMKDELLAELGEPGPPPGRKTAARTEMAPPPGVQERPPARETPPAKPAQEMTIKQMLGGVEQGPRKEVKDGPAKEPPKLPEGKIPTSPDLTSKIANVLQLEDKLKRRKFELEKRARGKDVPPPPTRPMIKEEIVVEETVEGAVEEAHEIELIRYATEEEEEEEDQFEEVDGPEIRTEASAEEKTKAKVKDTGIPESGRKESEGTDRTAPEVAQKRSHHEERKKKRRGIWALFGRG